MGFIGKISKFEIGRMITPKKIFSMNFKEELEECYSKVYSDNVNYLIVLYLFSASVILSLMIYLSGFQYLYPFVEDYFDAGTLMRLLTIYFTFFILNMVLYYFILLGFLFYLLGRHSRVEHEIEKDLPEFIDSLISNIKGGISLEKALLQSVRKDQKALMREVSLINEKIIMGKTAIESLREFRGRFASPIINRTIFLMEEGLKGGGNLAAPLERISGNLKKIYNLDEEIKSNSSGFAIIITFITLIIAPLLFALAITLLSFISSLFELLGSTDAGLFSGVDVPEEFSSYLRYFSYAMIVLITFFSSLITAQLKNEKTYTVAKYLPIYILIALLLYNVFSGVLLNFFGGIIS